MRNGVGIGGGFRMGELQYITEQTPILCVCVCVNTRTSWSLLVLCRLEQNCSQNCVYLLKRILAQLSRKKNKPRKNGFLDHRPLLHVWLSREIFI